MSLKPEKKISVNPLKLQLYRLKVHLSRNIFQPLTASSVLGLFKMMYGSRPVPVQRLWAMRRTVEIPNRILKAKHPLLRKSSQLVQPGSLLNHPLLAEKFADYEFGDGSLPIDTLNFLEQQIQHYRPKRILEFGSGISTVCLTQYMRDLHGDTDQIYVLSFEQEQDYVEYSENLLVEHNLAQHARILYAPMVYGTINGQDIHCYDFSLSTVQQALRQYPPDFVLVDGPKASYQVRAGTLLLLQPCLSSSVPFYLDDALRDWELEVAKIWDETPGIAIDGLMMVGKGVLTGSVGANTL